MNKKTFTFKYIIIFTVAFILGGFAVFLFGRYGFKFSGSRSGAKKGRMKIGSYMNMKPVKGEIIVNTRQRQLFGIKVGTVKILKLSDSVKGIGEVIYSVPLERTITLKYSGYVRRLFADKPGMEIRKGEPLFTVYSPELISSENDYVLAYKNFLKIKSSGYGFGVEEAKDFLDSSIFRLSRFGLTGRQLDSLRSLNSIPGHTTIYSPINGVLIGKSVFSGSYFKSGSTLFKLAGLSRVWMNVWIYEKDISLIKKGEKTSVEFASYPGKIFAGKISFIYPFLANGKKVDEVRLVFNNPNGLIKPGMYGNAKISVHSESVLAVPESAVLITGGKPIVFIYEGKGYFKPVYVKIGNLNGDFYPILSGLNEGEKIVVSGTFLMSSESNLSQAMGSMAGMPGM